MRRVIKIIIAATFLSLTIFAQSAEWDLSYKSLLERNNVAKNEWIRMWLNNTKSPAADWISNWKGMPIVSSVLIEHPAFHAAERTTTWLIRTDDEAFYWDHVEGTKYGGNKEPISLKIYDDIYKQVVAWKQLQPKSRTELPRNALTGYIGFLSHAGPDGSRQMLLTLDDFMTCLDKECMPGKGIKSGRLMTALEPILIPDAVKNYKHKTEAEIARMTPAERIDEQINENDHMMDHSDKQGDLIRKYRRLDGLKGHTRLIELMDGYNPERLRDLRYYDALMIATEIDEGIIRLRASDEGRRIIEAVERLAARVRVVRKEDSEQIDETLRSMKEINFADNSVRDTLWMRHRIKLSDAELLEFTNYLVKHHPTYPSWSEREHALDHSEINEAGNPRQVFIMKYPIRYYESYLAFKRASVPRQ